MWYIQYIFLAIILAVAIFIILIMEGKISGTRRNAWDIMLFNTTFAIVIIFMVGILDNTAWEAVIYSLGAVATGTGIAGILKARHKNE